MVDSSPSSRLARVKRKPMMETINRFSASSSSEANSPRPSLSSRFSVSDLRSRSVQTPVSSTMGVNDPQSSANSRMMNSLDTDTASSNGQDDPDEWFEKFRDDVDDGEPSDDIPTQSQLDAAADIPIYDSEGNSRPFRHLYQGAELQGQRQLVIFVRHFYCGVCQAYIKALIETITPKRYFSLPIPTTITLIGCGRPALLAKYLKRTSCPFRMYSEPTRKLYKALQMPLTWTMGKKSAYHNAGQLAISKDTFGQMIKSGLKEGTTGGHVLQIGGEFMFEDGEPIWCHRMRVMRDHTEMKAMERILHMTTEELKGLRDDSTPTTSPSVPSAANLDHTPRNARQDVITHPPRAVTPRRGMKLIWEDRGDDAPPKGRLERGR